MMKYNDKKKYIECSVPEFLFMFPDEYKMLEKETPELLADILDDKDYIIRISSDGVIELGYISDKWVIS